MKFLLSLLSSALALVLAGEIAPNGGGYNGPVSCCLPSGSCKIFSSHYCRNVGGHALGPVQILANAQATEVDEEGMLQPDLYYGHCAEEVAAQCPGACCFPDRCEFVSEADCCGLYRGNGTSCEHDCSGACCADDTCAHAPESSCEGTFHGIGTHCLPMQQCPRTDWIGGIALLFAVLFFLTSLVLLIFVCRRNYKYEESQSN
jgi:hypothetical protein